jgi:hypothetical protein
MNKLDCMMQFLFELNIYLSCRVFVTDRKSGMLFPVYVSAPVSLILAQV